MGLDYRQAGVDIDKGDGLVPVYKKAAERTRIPGVLGNLGGFGSLFSLKDLDFASKRDCSSNPYLDDPVLVSGTDGVGTKLLLARDMGVHTTVGIDLVAMCVNDILTCGAKPLFFLDYFGCGVLDPGTAAEVVEGIAEGCARGRCALTGGETAELPGMYPEGEYDLAGFAVGVVDRNGIIDGSRIETGDVVIGLDSSGIHSNGYSLVRKVIETAGLSLDEKYDGLEETLGEVLLTPTMIYTDALAALDDCDVRGLAHITGGGLPGNAARVLPDGKSMTIDKQSWEVPAVFRLLREKGGIAEDEMFRTFNMGIGMVCVLPEADVAPAVESLRKGGFIARRIGTITEGNGKVILN